MENKEILENLNEKAAEDLKDAKVIPYGNEKEDVDICLLAKSQLENADKNIGTQLEGVESALRKNTVFLGLFEKLLKSAVIEQEELDLIKENKENLIKVIDENKNMIDRLKMQKANIVKVLEQYNLETKEDGKAYFNDFAIILSKILNL